MKNLYHKILEFIRANKRYFGVIIILLTGLLFFYYIVQNPNALSPIKDASLVIIPLLLTLFFGVLVTNFFITVATIHFSKKQYPAKQSFMLTIYSTLVNFFGPLQSGPGFRAVYLKQRIGLSVKLYTLISIVYYGIFLAMNLILVFGFIYPLATASVIFMLGIVGLLFIRKRRVDHILKMLFILGLITIVQLAITVLIYFVELKSVGYQPSMMSVLTYTGSANLALFVSITPGAIGVRESFLYFSQSLHNIPTEIIVNASLLDRAVYLIFLAILFISSSTLHIGRYFTSNQDKGV